MSLRRITPAEQFARLLDGGSPSPGGIDPALTSMTDLAGALRAAGQAPGLPSPDPAFRAALRQRLVAVGSVQVVEPVGDRSRLTTRAATATKYRVQRRIAALAGVVTVATSVAGVGVAAARSLPGDPFYDVKRATENVQLWATFGDQAKGRRHLEFARTRLAEAAALSPSSSHIASTLAAMDAETKEGSSDLISAYQSSHSTVPLADLVRFSSQQVKDLTHLASTLPPGLQAKDAQSIKVVTGVVSQVHHVAHGVCVLCTPTGVQPNGHTSTSPSPTSHPSRHHSSAPGVHPSTSTHPGQSVKPTKSAGAPKHSPSPTKTPLIPIPSGPLSSLLHPKHSKHPVSIVSSLLGGL
jgi:hypothetical protein